MSESPSAYTLSDSQPVYSYIQRVEGQIQTTRGPGPPTTGTFFPIADFNRRPASTITFNSPQVAQNLFLCADAYIKVKARIRRYKIDNATDIGSSEAGSEWYLERVPMKPGMVLANSFTRADIRLNQHTISYKDLRYCQKNINVQSFGKDFIEKNLSTSGGRYWDNQGQLSFSGECSNNVSTFLAGPTPVVEYSTNLGIDNGYSDSCDKFNSFLGNSGDVNTDGTKIIEITEPLGIGPFKPRNKKGYGNSVYHGLSDLIPYVNQVGLKLVLENFSANLCAPYFMAIDEASATEYRGVYLDDGIIEAELVLKWVRPRSELILNIPKQLYIPSWQMDHREFILNEGNPILCNDSVNFSFENIYTRQIPSQIFVWATVDKDSIDSYLASPLNTWNTPALAGVFPHYEIINTNQTAFESNCAFRELTMRTNTLGGTDIWNESFNEDEQYKYTTEGCHPDFPWNNTKWNGYALRRFATTPPAQFMYMTRGYNFLLLDTDDLKQYNITGPKTGKLVRDQVWNFSGIVSPQDGLMDNTGYTITEYPPPIAGGSPQALRSLRKYKFHVAFMYNNYRINLGYDGVVSSDFVSKFY